MTVFQAILLGIVQGATEFLPISSSGHLVLVPYLLGWDIPPEAGFIFDVLVQVATLVAVFAYFWQEVINIVRAMFAGIRHRRTFSEPKARLGWLLLLATLPAIVLGLLLKRHVARAFDSPIAAAAFLLVTAALLVISEILGERKRNLMETSWIDALVIGCFQVFALFPGLSRSGATITGGMLRNLKRPAAARFSFLISIPVMLAAGFLALLDLIALPNSLAMMLVFLPGFLVAIVVGYFSIRWLLGYLARRSLYLFAIYCVGLGIITIIVSIL